MNPTAAPAPSYVRRPHIPELATEEAIEIGPELGPVECTFEIGDNVVYPHHGAGVVLKKETKDLLGEKRDYLTIKILHNNMTVMVPCENAHRAGLRRVIDGEEVNKVIDVLTGEVSDMPKNWNRRFKHNREKIKTGDVFELAEVVRNLAIREWEKGLSTGEKQMYTRAKKILASEFMYALEQGRGRGRGLPGRAAGGALRGHRRLPDHPSASAVIAAAGSGERLGAGGPKAFVPLAGRPLVAWALDAFARAGSVASVIVAAPPGHEAAVEELAGGIDLELRVVAGGDSPLGVRGAGARAASRRTWLRSTTRARPLVTPELIDELVAKLASRPDAAGVIAAAPLADTVKRAREPRPAKGPVPRGGPTVAQTVSRDHLWAAQTPQVFRTRGAARGPRHRSAADRRRHRRRDAGREGRRQGPDPPGARREPQGDHGARPADRRAAAGRTRVVAAARAVGGSGHRSGRASPARMSATTGFPQGYPGMR